MKAVSNCVCSALRCRVSSKLVSSLQRCTRESTRTRTLTCESTHQCKGAGVNPGRRARREQAGPPVCLDPSAQRRACMPTCARSCCTDVCSLLCTCFWVIRAVACVRGHPACMSEEASYVHDSHSHASLTHSTSPPRFPSLRRPSSVSALPRHVRMRRHIRRVYIAAHDDDAAGHLSGFKIGGIFSPMQISRCVECLLAHACRMPQRLPQRMPLVMSTTACLSHA